METGLRGGKFFSRRGCARDGVDGGFQVGLEKVSFDVYLLVSTAGAPQNHRHVRTAPSSLYPFAATALPPSLPELCHSPSTLNHMTTDIGTP